ncbi:MAG: hypothetical protein J5666_06355 [Bacilli bacterium]|nr:hypothetical protein [Bacilli bacterium]
MSKKFSIISLIITTIVGSLFTALGSNMLFDDLFNKDVPFANHTLFVSLPAVSVCVILVMLVLYIIRVYKHPDCQKRISRLYLIIAIVMGVIGVVGAVLGGVKVYGTFTGKHPFPGYLIIFMILNILIIGCAVCGLVFLKKMKEDTGKVKINAKHVFKTIGWFLFISMMFNRLGMLLGASSYIYLRNLYKTFPFYLYLLMPVFLGVLVLMSPFEILDRKKRFILGLVALGLNVCFFGYIALMGINDTAFISSLSQAMPLERMASKPLEILIHFLTYTGVGVAVLVLNKKSKEKVGE